jgi:branched-chain amino acid transport system substrate-binding protein
LGVKILRYQGFRALGRLSIVSLVLLAAGCGSSNGSSGSSGNANGPGVTSSTITFGQTTPQSGPAALYGESENGVLAYFDYVNAHGGVLGRHLRLISLDDQYSPAVSVQATRKLINNDHVFAEVAVNGSATNKANLTVQVPQNVPVIGPQSGATFLLSPFRKNLYNVWPSYLTEGNLLGSFAMKNLHLTKPCVLYQNDDFGQSLYKGVQNSGMKATKAIPYDPTQTDFSPQAQQFKTAGCDGIIILAIPGSTIKFLNALSAISYTPVRLMSQVSAIPQSFSAAPTEFPGSYVGAFIPPLQDTTNPDVSQFTAAMAKYQPGKPVSVFAAWGWMEAQVAVAGLKKVKGAVSRDNYETALNSLANLHTIGGTISYSSTSHPGVQHMFIVRAQGGKLVRVTS